MFAPKDEKALFRIGAKVTHDFHPGEVFKIVKKYRDANGSLNYTIGNDLIQSVGVRQKDLNKATA
jgi:hypothetical protein